MSVFHSVQWSVNPPDEKACEEAVKALAEHVKSVHPTAKSFRTYRQDFGPLPLVAYFAILEWESMTAWDNDLQTPTCEAIWAPIYKILQSGSMVQSFWSDSQRESWFER